MSNPKEAIDTTTKLALRPKEAAKAIGISERKLWSITADQTSGIPHTRFGKCVVYPVAALDRWLDKRATSQNESH